jgi:hypothetical protein
MGAPALLSKRGSLPHAKSDSLWPQQKPTFDKKGIYTNELSGGMLWCKSDEEDFIENLAIHILMLAGAKSVDSNSDAPMVVSAHGIAGQQKLGKS